MERARPRVSSICLPTGHEKVRLVLVPLALVASVWVGTEVFSHTKTMAEAITAGVMAVDIALHIVEMLVHALAFSRWALVAASELMVGTIAGLCFFLAFNETGEAVAVGLTTANIALHLAEVAIEAVVGKHQHAKTGDNQPRTTRYLGGSGGPVASTGAA
ncbi:hypothetical protein ABZ636_31280 [Streptomyces sp. NPDC007251]|uniref:hypothetical protein n=1 Tax=Streptomyces sp. NPDC007251 TaxID=3154483 RepID=UPI0033C96C97